MVDIHIPPDSQRNLLRLSRLTLENIVRGNDDPAPATDDPHLQTRDYGAFVSLHKGQALRGCVGTCVPTERLYRLVVDMTRAAGSRDGRVAPVAAAELDEIHIDISVLSPLEEARDPLALVAGKHGLYVRRGANHGVLLPQVARAFGWDMKSFLERACAKAGLPENAWTRPGTRVSSFTALIIEEAK